MGKISVEITNPTHQKVLIGAAAASLTLQGTVAHPNPASLFYKWYSSLYIPAGINSPADAPKAALNYSQFGLSALSFPAALAIGTHTLTLVVKDVVGEDLASANSVRQASMAGGPEISPKPPDAPNPCVVHVLIADMYPPPSLNLSKSAPDLEARAPAKWDVNEYQAVNRLRFRWRFEPQGGGTPVAGVPKLDASDSELAQFQKDLQFKLPDANHPAHYLRYQGSLPAVLVVGQKYRLVLRVEDNQPPHGGDESATIVTIVV